MQSFPRTIAIAGTSSSGKTTLGRRIAALSGIPYVELDALHWEANWTPAAPDAFRERVTAALDRESWIVDGNYSIVRDLTWGRAEHLIWLDLPLPMVLARLTKRTFSRWFRKEELWNGNREELRMAFLSRESLYLWVLQTHRRHRREYPAHFARNPHMHVTRVRSPRELEQHIRALQRLMQRDHTDGDARTTETRA